MSIPGKIVFIDDDSVTNFLTNEILKRKRYEGEATFFDSASKALLFFQDIDEAHIPDVIFLDIKMPEMDGFDFLDEFMKHGLNKKMKSRIYMLTSSVSSTDEERTKNYPIVSGFLNKPFSYEFLQDMKA